MAMNMETAEQLGIDITGLIQTKRGEEAYQLLAPILAARTPFRYLGRIGETFGKGCIQEVDDFLARVADQGTEGGWVVIAGALKAQLNRDLFGAFERARRYIITADIWYGADIFGERIPGPGIVLYFNDALPLLECWKDDPNRWVRRTVGVAVHFWAKRAHGEEKYREKVIALLHFLEPMFTEWNMDAAKGVGWALKTLGRYYPNLLVEWLPGQIKRKHRTIMLKKALTYLPKEDKTRIKMILEE